MRFWLAIALILLPPVFSAQTSETPVDEATGLAKGENWEGVKEHCTTCHSATLITRQRGTRTLWKDVVRWMQVNHGMPALQVQVEEEIVSYLATYYAPPARYRRLPLPISLMPPNPYSTLPPERLPQ